MGKFSSCCQITLIHSSITSTALLKGLQWLLKDYRTLNPNFLAWLSRASSSGAKLLY